MIQSWFILSVIFCAGIICTILIAIKIHKTWLGKKDKYKWCIILIFVMAAILRMSLSIVNQDAYDNHFEVIDIIKDEDRLPTLEDCHQCYHPKLYHATVAAILEFFPLRNHRIKLILAQLLNSLAGLLTIYIVWIFLNNSLLADRVKLISFSLVALNPKLIGVNAMVSNDSFVIFFSTLAMYLLHCFFASKRPKYFLALLISTILAGLTKANGLVLFAAILLIFVLIIIKDAKFSLNPKKGYLAYLLIFLFTFLLIVPKLGQYDKVASQGGTLIFNYHPRAPFPNFFKDATTDNDDEPEITSIKSGYFTFRLFGLLKHPKNQGESSMPTDLHEISLWSQLYAQTHDINFDYSSGSWQTDNKVILNMSRAIFVLALLPTFFLLVEIGKRLKIWFGATIKREFDFIRRDNDWIFDILFIGYIAAIIFYTLMFRNNDCMKAMYIFPALIAVVSLVSKGLERIYRLFEQRNKLALLFDAGFSLLFLLYVVTTASLIYRLLNS
ncbi:phospholipid carrier-dependent glycosyltransferase [Candidatus Omnitrophota bacterium]